MVSSHISKDRETSASKEVKEVKEEKEGKEAKEVGVQDAGEFLAALC